MVIRAASVLLWCLIPSGDFKVPGPEERLAAIGEVNELPEALRRAFEPGEDFQPIPAPGPADWLAVHEEPGQTFRGFRQIRRNVPDGKRRRIYLQPLGSFPEGSTPPFRTLRDFAAAFFGLEVEVLETLPVEKDDFSPRVNAFTGKRQLLTGDIIRFLRSRLPPDAFCLLGITLEDLYPSPTWNFVFGQASLVGRTGIYSFVRYDPQFYGQEKSEEERSRLRLRRSLKVLAHETAHMFGMHHCIYFSCLANGSNHLEESDSRPLHLCPVCLRKLHAAVGFDVVDRYRNLRDFHRKAGIEDEARWLQRRLEAIGAGEPRDAVPRGHNDEPEDGVPSH